MTTNTTTIAQHSVETIKITEPDQLSGGTYARDIEIHTEDGETLHIDVYAENGEEDIKLEVK